MFDPDRDFYPPYRRPPHEMSLNQAFQLYNTNPNPPQLSEEEVLAHYDFSGTARLTPPGYSREAWPDGTPIVIRTSASDDSSIRHVTVADFEQYKQLCAAIQAESYGSLEDLFQHGAPMTTEIVQVALNTKDTKILDVFLQNGWDIDMTLGFNLPSALALTVNDPTLTEWLLDHGASPNTMCDIDLTPLSWAVMSGPMSIIQSFFQHGGSIQHGQFLHYAVRRDLPDYLEVFKMILSKNPPINKVMYQDQLDSYYKDSVIPCGTPLGEAAAYGRFELVQFLIEAGANPLIKDARGQIPIKRAERWKHRSVVEYLRPITEDATPPGYQFTEGSEVRPVR